MNKALLDTYIQPEIGQAKDLHPPRRPPPMSPLVTPRDLAMSRLRPTPVAALPIEGRRAEASEQVAAEGERLVEQLGRPGAGDDAALRERDEFIDVQQAAT